MKLAACNRKVLLALAACLWIAALASWLVTFDLFSQAGDEHTVHELEKKTGEAVERYANGSFKVSLAWTEIHNDRTSEVRRFEKWKYIDEEGWPIREIIKTPTMEVVKETERHAEGGWRWKPAEVVRDERTVIGRLGLPLVFWPYHVVAVVFAALGVVVLALLIASCTGPGRMDNVVCDGETDHDR